MGRHAVFAAVVGAVLAWPASAEADPGDKISDSVSALPQDRMIFNYNYYEGGIGYRHMDLGDGSDEDADFGHADFYANWRLGDMWRATGSVVGDVFDFGFVSGHTLGASGGFFYIPGTDTALRVSGYARHPGFVIGATGGLSQTDTDVFGDVDFWWLGGTGKIYGDRFNVGGSLLTGDLEQEFGESDIFYANLNGEIFLHDRFSIGGSFDHLHINERDVSLNRVGVALEWQPWIDRSLSFGVEAGHFWIDADGPVATDDRFDIGFRISWACFGSAPVTPTLLERSWMTYNDPMPRLVRIGF